MSTDPNQEQFLQLVTKLLNDKGRVTIRVKSVWIPVIAGLVGAVIGSLVSFAVWVNTGKADLLMQGGVIAAAIEDGGRVHGYHSNAVANLAADMVSATQLRIYSERLEARNTNLTVPDLDQIRSWYRYTLPNN